MAWQESPESDCVAGYELELSDVNALRGPQPWRKAYRGKKHTLLLKSLGREIAGIRARVRAYNSAGKGEWSPESQMIRLPRPEAPPRREIEEIPAGWLLIDLAGLPELKEDNDPFFLQLTKRDLLQSLHQNRTVLKILFRYYALAGVSNVDDDADTMTQMQFGNFCFACRMVDSKSSLSDIDRIFLRAVRVLPAAAQAAAPAADGGLGSALGETGIKVTKFAKAKAAVNVTALITKGGNFMNQNQFIAAVVRLAAARYPEEHISLAEKVTTMCAGDMHEHAFNELKLIDDDFTRDRFRSRYMGAALGNNVVQLRQVFEAYARADLGDAKARRKLVTMNVIECNCMCEDVGIYDKSFTTRDLLAIFCRVNIDDDLYYQTDQADTGTELVFDEFEEVVARIYFEAVHKRMLQAQATASLLDQDGDGDLDDDDIDDLFNECDADKSGSISLDELSEALSKRLNAGAARMFAQQLVAVADEDGSGTMSRDELAHAIRKISSDASAGRERPGDMEKGFEAWLSDVFLPPAIKGATKRKLMGA